MDWKYSEKRNWKVATFQMLQQNFFNKNANIEPQQKHHNLKSFRLRKMRKGKWFKHRFFFAVNISFGGNWWEGHRRKKTEISNEKLFEERISFEEDRWEGQWRSKDRWGENFSINFSQATPTLFSCESQATIKYIREKNRFYIILCELFSSVKRNHKSECCSCIHASYSEMCDWPFNVKVTNVKVKKSKGEAI